jgi:hypothetical protein
VEGAFGPFGLVTGAFQGQFRGPAHPLVPVGDLVGSSQRQRHFGRVQRGQQPPGDRVIDGGRGDRAAGRGGQPVRA